MAYTLVQSASGNTGASNASSCTVTSSSTTAGNLLVAFVWINGTSSVTITAPSGWSIAGSTHGTSSGNATCGLYYKANIPGSVTSHQWTFGSSVNASIAFEEWHGVATSSPLDQTTFQLNAQGTSTTTATTATLAQSGELAIWGAGVGATNQLTYSSVTNSYTWDNSASAASSQSTKANANLFYNTSVGTAGTSSGATASGSGANGNTTIIATFLPGGTTVSRTIPATAALQSTNARTIPVTTALSGTVNRTIPTAAALQSTNLHSIPATGAIANTFSRIILAVAAFTVTNLHSIPATAALQSTNLHSIPAHAALQSTNNPRSIPATAALQSTNLHSIPATGALNIELIAGGFAVFANGTGTASFNHLRVTQYPDPALSLAPITPRLGGTGVDWNAVLPGNTTLGTDISYDGVNFTDVTSGNGAALPTLYPQPGPTIDGFSTNTSANYTSTSRTGGSAGTWTYDTANSRLVATSGTNALYLNSLLSRADIDFFADLDQSDAGGLVWRFVDTNNFYYLRITDSLSSTGVLNTVTLYKVASNTQTILSSAPISYSLPSYMASYTTTFVRGTFRRFRVTMLAGVITVYVDGNVLLAYTDNSPLAAGQIGLYNNGGTTGSRYYQLWIQPIGDIVTGSPAGDTVTGDFVYTRLRLATTDPTVTPQVEDISTYAFTPDIQSGVSIPSANYNASFISKNFDDLAKQSNYSWYIDPYKRFVFRSYQAAASPWILQSAAAGLMPISDINWTSNFERDVSNDLYRNRQTILGAWDSLSDSITFFGDGNTQQFILGYPLASAPTITLNGAPQTVGLKGTSGSAWYYAVQDSVIVQDATGIVLQDTDTLVIAYTGLFEVTVQVDDGAEQARVAAIEGGTGIVEQVEDHSSDKPYLSYNAAVTLANQLIDRYAIAGRTLIFDTTRDGLAIGQTLSIFLPEEGIWDGQFIIIQLEIYLRKGVGDTQVWTYKVTASELPKQASWAKLIASGLGLQ